MVCLWQLLPRTWHVRSWRKPTPHSRRIRWSTAALDLQALSWDRVPEQALSLCFDGLVALTSGFLQSLPINHPDTAAPITDQASLLKRVGHKRHAGTMDLACRLGTPG